jgi:5-dehydro-2-deoxygluconokinase
MTRPSHPLFRHRNNFLVIGRAGLDLYADPPGSKVETAGNFTSALGGSAANIAVAITRQGGKAALLTSVSDDAVGRFVMNALAAYGIDSRYVIAVSGEARTSLAVVETRANNCQSVIYRNNAADFLVTAQQAEAVDLSVFTAVIVTGTCLAHEPSRTSTLNIMQQAKDTGRQLVIDIDYRPYSWTSKSEARDICLAAAEECDIIVGNDEEFAVLAGGNNGLALAKQLARREGRIVVYKKGADGCTTFHDSQQFETPVYPVTALKPTGAGDAFMGGFIAGLGEGESLADAARRGAATAALVVTRVGCAPAMPDAVEVHSFKQQA